MKFTDLIWILFIIGMVVFAVESYFSLPVVYWSYSTDECVKVIYDGYETDCSELPEKYERIWVK